MTEARGFQILQPKVYAKTSARAARLGLTNFRSDRPSSQGFGYAKDARQVYQGGFVITGADPATFVVDPSDPEKASDKNRRYQYSKPVP